MYFMAAQVEAKTAFTPEQTAILRQDFGDFTNKVLKASKAFDTVFMPGEADVIHGERLVTMGGIFKLYDGVAWPVDKDAPYHGKPIGTPEDYLKIRDNYDALINFVAKTLDRGRIDTSTDGHGGGPDETNPADYINFLHTASSNPVFKENLETAVIQLFNEEIERNFQPYPYKQERRKAENHFKKVEGGKIGTRFSYMYGNDDLHMAIWRLGLDDVTDPVGLGMKAFAEKELGKTERPIIKGSPYKRVHLSETSQKFKKALLNYDLDREAYKNAGKKFAPQFKRLVGLLDVIIHQGSPKNGFSDLYEVLKNKAEQGIFSDIPNFEMGISEINLRNHILLALSGIQKSDELRDFWFERIKYSPNIQRIMTAVYGVLQMHENNVVRRQEIPDILAELQTKFTALHALHKVFPMDGFYYQQTLLTDVLDIIEGNCYGQNTFYYFNKHTGTLDYLLNITGYPDHYIYTFDRYSPKGKTTSMVRYIVSMDNLIGDVHDTSFVKSVKAHIDERGFELPNNVWVTSINGRKREDGRYEGVIGLNRTAIPFLYTQGDTVLLAPPLEEERTNALFSGRDTWKGRKINFYKLNKQFDEKDFVHLANFSSTIKEIVKKRKEERLIADTSYSLEQVDFAELEPYLVKLLEARLILHPVDLTS